MAGLVQLRRNNILYARRKGTRKLDTLFRDTTKYFHGLSLNLIDAIRNINKFSYIRDINKTESYYNLFFIKNKKKRINWKKYYNLKMI